MPRPVPEILLDPDALALVRSKTGIQLTAIARKTGYSLGYINDLAKGRRGGNPEVVRALAQALDVPPSLLERRREPAA